jgi:hypothetical protein
MTVSKQNLQGTEELQAYILKEIYSFPQHLQWLCIKFYRATRNTVEKQGKFAAFAVMYGDFSSHSVLVEIFARMPYRPFLATDPEARVRFLALPGKEKQWVWNGVHSAS